MTERKPKLVLIDGNSITYRAFFALPPLSNAKGQFTNAVYGFTQMLLKLIADEQPTHIAVAFDAGKKTFRHDVYEAYKGTRQKTPSELSEQFPLVKDVLQAFAIPVIEIPLFEADDIIGTLATRADAEGLETLVVSGDKDLLQLVTDHVHAAVTKKGITEVQRYNRDGVRERYELTPAQVVDLKGLMGDASDNIPGVPGVGEKTAIKLLKQYETVEEVLAHLDEIPGKLQEKLRDNQDKALLSKQLATINREAPVDRGISELAYSGYDASALKQVFMDLGFKSLLDKISGEIDNPSVGDAPTAELPAWAKTSVTIVTKKRQLDELWRKVASPVGVMPNISMDAYQTADLLGIAVASKGQAFYVSFEEELDPTDVLRLWSDEYDKVVYDLKALTVILDSHGHSLTYDGTWFDVMIGAYLLNPSDGELKLSDLLERELNVGAAYIQDIEHPETLGRIALALQELKKHLTSAIATQELEDLYRDVELPLAVVLAKMEALGFQVNGDWLRAYGAELQTKLAQLQSEIYSLAETEFNINSPKQLGEVLFEKLGLPAQKKTKTGYSTSADVLEKLAPFHDVVQKILEFRQLGKLQSTYVDGLLKVIRPETGRVHTRFHQTLTATGRLSSTEPNLQNIPIRMEEGRKLRQAFEPSYGDWAIVSADYSQIELRILAHLSGDEALIDAFRHGADIHTSTAATVFGVAPEAVTSLMRRQAKAVNFGIVYGISDYGLSQNLGISRKQAAEFIAEYFNKFPGVEQYMKDIVESAKKHGYVTTLLNRRRYLPDIHSRNFNLRSFAERTAMNTPIQGTAADIIKLAMVRIDEALTEQEDISARMLLQVHDELIFECPMEHVEPLRVLVEEKMENALTLNVPLKVDINVGSTWYDAK